VKTDSIFFQIFKTDPGILFELLGQSPNLAQNYDFRSVEIKQIAFRIDGVFLPKPDAADQTVWFLEVQFQKDPVFYQRFFGEIYSYLNLHPETVDWQAVVIFPRRSIEPINRHVYRANLNSDQVHRIYLEDLRNSHTESLGVGLMQLILADNNDVVTQVQALLSKTQNQVQTDPKIAAIMDIIETIVVYKFPKLSRDEIKRMFGLSELRETKVYQEGRQEGERSLILRLLTRRIGNVTPELTAKVQTLSLTQLEALGEALLDFSQPADLITWLDEN
jgi:predicted transposase/invertase (TIGR01784 family)